MQRSGHERLPAMRVLKSSGTKQMKGMDELSGTAIGSLAMKEWMTLGTVTLTGWMDFGWWSLSSVAAALAVVVSMYFYFHARSAAKDDYQKFLADRRAGRKGRR